MEFAHFDLGNVLTILTVEGTVLAAAFRLLGRINLVIEKQTNMSVRVADIESELKKQTDILIELAQTRERMNALEKRIDDLASRLVR